MSHHYAPGKAQVSMTPYQDRPRPTGTRGPYPPNYNNTVPRVRNPSSAPPIRTIFGVRIRNPLSPSPLSPTGQQSPFGSTLRFRYPSTTPSTPTVQTPYGTALRPRTPSQGSQLPLSPTSPSPFGPSIRPRTPSPLPQSPSPTQNQPYYAGTLNRNSTGSQLSLHQYPNSPGVLQRNSYQENNGSNRNPNMNRVSYESDGYNRNPSSASTLNRTSYESNNGYNRNPSASTQNRTSYETNNYNYGRNNSTATLNRYPAQGMNTVNRNPSTASKFSRKASYDAPLPVFPPHQLTRNSSQESSPPPKSNRDPVRRSPSVTSTKRKGPHSNKGSRLLSEAENEWIYSILGKGRQTLSSAAVQLLFPSTENEHQWKLREVGILCFVRDAPRKSYFLEVISLRMKRVIFSQEIYEEFDYRMPRPKYLTFEGDNSRIGLNFASLEEALDFKEILDQKMDAKRQRRMDRQSKYLTPNQSGLSAPTISQAPPALNRMQHQWNGHTQQQTYSIDPDASIPQQFEHNVTLTTNNKSKKGKSKLTFRKSKAAKLLKPGKNSKPVKLDKSAIGAPMDFKHVQHAGFDPKRGFVSDVVDQKYWKILAEIGVAGSKAESMLKDKDTRQFIYNFVEDYEQNVSNPSTPVEKSTSCVPPPPSKTATSSKAPSAPPPVPNRQVPEIRKNSMPKVIPPPPPFPGMQAASVNRNQPPAAPLSHKHPDPPRKSSVNVPPPPPPQLSSGTSALPPPPPPMPSQYTQDIDKPDYDDEEEGNPNHSTGSTLPTVSDGRSDLMKQIQEAQRNKLKKVDPNATLKKSFGGLSDVLNEIRNGTQLKKADESDRTAAKSPESLDGLAGALARALAERSKAINPESSASEEEDDFDTEDDWDD